MRRLFIVVLIGLVAAGCTDAPARRQKISLFVGVDVSGSFYNSGYYSDALDFLAHYIYGHMNEIGGCKPLKALFVGSVGGNTTDEAKSFHPIQDFDGKSVAQLESDLHEWFPKLDAYTDFNVFFKQIAGIVQKRNLSLSPIEIILLSDGVPDTKGNAQDKFEGIDVSSLEFLSRSTTIRLLYATPVVAKKWETSISRKRVRMWTVDNQVMQGWRNQMQPDVPLEHQDKFWAWVLDNVDYRVGPVRVHSGSSKK